MRFEVWAFLKSAFCYIGKQLKRGNFEILVF